MDVLISVAYHIAALELFIIALLSWRYNGDVTTGAGRFIGPFALLIAMLVIRADLAIIFLAFGVDLRLVWWWPVLTLVQAIAIAAIGANIVFYMLRRWRYIQRMENEREPLANGPGGI